MTVQEALKKVLDLANSEVGYKPYSGKKTKYADYLDKLGDVYNGKKSGYDWCDVFVDYLFIKTFGEKDGMAMIYQEYKGLGAGCPFSANYYIKNKAWSKVPQKGAQIFFGKRGDEYHTGIVYDIDDKYVYTIEGNAGGGNGKVMKRKYLKTADISGYGIPNWKVVDKKTAEPKPVKEQAKVFGIDISAHKGNYDLKKAKEEGVKFVIIKGGGGDAGLYKDSKFEANYKKAKDLGLQVGCYWFSKAMSVSAAKKEAEYFYKNCLKGKKFELPIYIDVENKSQLVLGKRLLTDIIIAWCSYLEALNFYVGIYSSASYFNTYMNDYELQGYAHWVAQWAKAYSGNAGLWQFGGELNYIRSNIVAGKVTDQDYLLMDYATAIKKNGLNGYGKTPEPAPTPSGNKLKVDGVFGAASTKAMQKWLGTYEDGEISGQIKDYAKYYDAIKTASFGGGGSPMVMELQRRLKVNADGILGMATIKAWQKWLVKQGQAPGNADGYFGPASAKAMQKFLNTL